MFFMSELHSIMMQRDTKELMMQRWSGGTKQLMMQRDTKELSNAEAGLHCQITTLHTKAAIRTMKKVDWNVRD
jgi:hypothetical protein